MSLVGVANETVRVVEKGEYVTPSGKTVTLGEAVERAVRGTVLYRPGDFERLTLPAAPGARRASR